MQRGTHVYHGQSNKTTFDNTMGNDALAFLLMLIFDSVNFDFMKGKLYNFAESIITHSIIKAKHLTIVRLGITTLKPIRC